ncbi:MAG TPA: TonB-dependent receptor plug domain-containing protein, partial [Chitinispirillaceae bacterium]|nr:TonB-dependent receptor plug domain-containing protein [Chitinispirillaceae bacterium]
MSSKDTIMNKALSLRNVRTILLCLVLVLSFFNNLYSADGNGMQSSVPEEDIEYLDYLLTLKITSGSFLDLNHEKSPVSMTIITREMIKLSGARNMSELLEIYVPGFQYMFNKWNGTLWGLRGVTNDRNTKIIYLINGHKMNTQARDGFQGETVLGLMRDIERIEVLRGPAGLVYGSGAIAGIVNVITKKASENKLEISTNYGTTGSQEYEANIYAIFPESDQIVGGHFKIGHLWALQNQPL